MQSFRRTLEKFYDEFETQLYTCALSVTRCPDLAEDAVQQAFQQLLKSDRMPESMKVYVFQCVRNAAIDQLRHRGKTVVLAEDYVFDSSADPRETAAQRQFQRRVAEALLKLSANERETIVQHLYAELTFREIAQLQKTPMGTVTSWYRRGIAKLRAQLEE